MVNISVINNLLMTNSFIPLTIFYFDNFDRKRLSKLGLGFLIFSLSFFLTGIFEYVYDVILFVYLPLSVQLVIIVVVILSSIIIFYSIAYYTYLVTKKSVFIFSIIWMSVAIICLFHPIYLFRVISVSFLIFVSYISYTSGDRILSLSTIMISLSIISTIFGGYFIVLAILATDIILLALSVITSYLFVKNQPVIITGKDLPRLQIFHKGRLYTVIPEGFKKSIVFHKYRVLRRDSKYIIENVGEFDSFLEVLLFILREALVIKKISFEKDKLIFEKESVLNPGNLEISNFDISEKMIRSLIGISLAVREILSLEFGDKNILVYPINLMRRKFYIGMYSNADLQKAVIEYINSYLERG